MKLRTALFLCLGALTIGACSDDDRSITDPTGPQAHIRLVNAVPDTGAVDFRFVDKLENLPDFLGLPFRGVSRAGYVAVAAGDRPVRIFVNSTDPVEAQKRLVDTTITLVAGSRYTLVYAGNARGGADRLAVVEDVGELPAPTGDLALRVLNTSAAAGAASVALTPAGAGASATPAATFDGVGYLAMSAYKSVAARPIAAGNLYAFAVTPASSPTFTVTPAEPGALPPADVLYGPTPGMQIAGSVMTAVLVPPAVAGSPAATASNLTPSVVIMFDKAVSK